MKLCDDCMVFSEFLSLIRSAWLPAGSERGQAILSDWQTSKDLFWQLVPPSEASTPEGSPAAEARVAGIKAQVPTAA